VLSNNLFDCHQLVTTSQLVPVGQDREPCQNCPNSIFLSDVVGTYTIKQNNSMIKKTSIPQ
jgi:hypothetical protein